MIIRNMLICRIFSTECSFFSPYSQIFCDFGESFTVVDTNGEQPISNMISSVTKVHVHHYR